MEIKSISLPFTLFFIIYRQLFDFHLQKRLKISHNNKKKNIEISLNEHLSEVCEHSEIRIKNHSNSLLSFICL